MFVSSSVVSYVFPTCVGMNRVGELGTKSLFSVPHMRGDEPLGYEVKVCENLCSPHAWG